MVETRQNVPVAPTLGTASPSGTVSVTHLIHDMFHSRLHTTLGSFAPLMATGLTFSATRADVR